MEERAIYIKTGWLKTNLYNLIGGLAIGVIICLFASVARGKIVSSEFLFRYTLFSVLISLGVSNAICIAQSVFRLSHERIWIFISVYYLSSIIGMAIGIEAAHFVLSLGTGAPFTMFNVQDYIFSSLIVIIVCTFSYTYHAQKASLNSRIKQKELDMMKLSQLKTQAELATLHSKINPHFLYNSLNSIASLIHIDADRAESMTLKLSKLFRYSINQNQENMVQVKDEIESANIYLDIEKVRFGGRLNFTFDVDKEVLEAKMPRFLIQPLVENALKHGLNNKAENGRLHIGIHGKGSELEITVADNGVPFPEELQIGYGLQSTYDKLHLLYGDDYQLLISDHPEKQVKIKIPLKYA